MMDPETKALMIGFHFKFIVDKDVINPNMDFYKKQFGIYEDLAKPGAQLGICWECWLKSMGVTMRHEYYSRGLMQKER